MELIHRTHPLGITTREVVVHSHHMHTLMCQGVEEYGECCHEGLTLTRCHLGDATLVQYDTTKELHIVVYHIPLDDITTRGPLAAVDSLVALDAHQVLTLGCEVAVEVVGSNHHLVVLGKAACCILHDCECLGENLLKTLLDIIVDALCEHLYLCREALLLLERCCGALEELLILYDCSLILGDEVGDRLT